MSITKRPDVIQDVIKAIEEGYLKYSTHAQKQMKARNILVSDTEEAIFNSHREGHKDSLNKSGTDWKYVLRGLNYNGDKDIRIVIAYHNSKIVVITAIDKNKETDNE